MAGSGSLWIDDLLLLVDGRSVSEAPTLARVGDPVASDREFDTGSQVVTQPLSRMQVEGLALLAEVWGFAKYHHPRVSAGGLNWDYELFRVMPSVLQSRSLRATAGILSEWLGRTGEIDECSPCAPSPDSVHLAPELAWIWDVSGLGVDLSHRLSTMYRNRPRSGEQYYVSQATGVGNPDFSNEAAYASHATPDGGYRLLALFRFWNIIQYWFRYRDVMEEDWDRVLREFIPIVFAAEAAEEYRLAMMQLSARIHDTHANLWGELRFQPPVGPAQLPVVLRFVEGKAVVTGYSHSNLGPATGLRPGDVIERIDGAPIDSLVRAWRPFYSASNEPTRLRDIARTLTRGNAGPAYIEGLRADGAFEVRAERAPRSMLDASAGRTHDLPGDTFQMLTDDVAYLKLSSVSAANASEYIRQAQHARVLVIDLRNYPSEFVVFALGRHLVATPTAFARFTVADLANPGAFRWGRVVTLQPLEPRFAGTVVILVDETTQSQAEYTVMAFRAPPNALVVGSTTAGADGNVSRIPLPGGTASMISGIGVFYPDGTPTQRVGILPDVVVRPTIAGVRSGRDEVLEAGVSRALGREFQLSSDRR